LYLEREGSLGEIVTGATADLVLLEENPLEDLQNLRDLVGVVKAGKWHTAASLQTRLDAIAEHYAAQEALFDDAPALAIDAKDVPGESVRTTAVKVGNTPVDFLGHGGTQAARLMVEQVAPVKATLALRKESGWAEATLASEDEALSITRFDGSMLSLERSEGVWSLRDGQRILWQLQSDGPVLPVTGTPLDIAIFAQLVGLGNDGSLPLHVWACDLASACAEEPVAAFLHDRGFEKIDAVYSGTRRIDLAIRNRGTMGIWIGAGPFYGGQPVRLDGASGNRWERLR
jgi:hypothetical protein